MNRLTPHLPESHVVLDLDVGSKKRLFEQIGLIFENSRQVARARVFDSLFDREKLGSTGLGCGVAIPHGRMKNLKETLCAFVRTRSPMPFEAPDDEPVVLLPASRVSMRWPPLAPKNESGCRRLSRKEVSPPLLRLPRRR